MYIATDPNDGIVGFALTYLIRSGSQWSKEHAYKKGSLAVLCVSPSHQNKGVGSALHSKALDHLTSSVKESFKDAEPIPQKSQIQLGSIFPRIFPGLPEGAKAFDDAKLWFERRGWAFGLTKSIDLYQHFKAGKRDDTEGLMKKAVDGGFRFGEPGKEDVEGLLQLQKDNFESYTVGPDVCHYLVGVS